MYMIPHFLKNEAKKLLKSKISEIMTNITDEFIDNIFLANPDTKYQDIALNLDEKIKRAVIEIIKNTFEIFDNLYAKSDERKKIFNISESKCHRSIITIFGLLEFDRIYYYEKGNKNKHFYFIDTLFRLPKWDRYDKIVKGLAIDNAISVNQKKGAELTNKQINSISQTLENREFCKITRQDIYLWIDKWNVPDIEYDPIQCDEDTLYIMIDEKYIHEQLKTYLNKENNQVETKTSEEIKTDILKIVEQLTNPSKQLLLPAPKEKSHHFIMSKAFVAFTNISTEGKKRVLQNKMTFLTTSKNPWDEFMDFIPKIYDFKQFKTIKVLSDAGSWILSGISNLKLYVENVIIPCLCEFHVRQKVNRITKDEALRKSLNKAIDDDDKSAFTRLIKNILKNKDSKRTKKIKEYSHYISSHWNSIREMRKSKYKSSMESHISHNIAKYFSFEPKSYSKRHIQKLIKLQEYKANGINILALYLKSSNNSQKITLKKEELNFAIFENPSSSNLPDLNQGYSLTRQVLRAITS